MAANKVNVCKRNDYEYVKQVKCSSGCNRRSGQTVKMHASAQTKYSKVSKRKRDI